MNIPEVYRSNSSFPNIKIHNNNTLALHNMYDLLDFPGCWGEPL